MERVTPAAPVHVVVMGVSGSGKTTIAELLHERTGWLSAEADEFHPQANIDKMTRGEPLDDDDRRPWLEALTAWMAEKGREERSTIVTCSALKRSYRDMLRTAGDGVLFVHLDGDRETLADRMQGRTGHFMPVSLLDSQLATLEKLDPDEPGLLLSIEDQPAELVDRILAELQP